MWAPPACASSKVLSASKPSGCRVTHTCCSSASILSKCTGSSPACSLRVRKPLPFACRPYTAAAGVPQRPATALARHRASPTVPLAGPEMQKALQLLPTPRAVVPLWAEMVQHHTPTELAFACDQEGRPLTDEQGRPLLDAILGHDGAQCHPGAPSPCMPVCWLLIIGGHGRLLLIVTLDVTVHIASPLSPSTLVPMPSTACTQRQRGARSGRPVGQHAAEVRHPKAPWLYTLCKLQWQVLGDPATQHALRSAQGARASVLHTSTSLCVVRRIEAWARRACASPDRQPGNQCACKAALADLGQHGVPS